MAWDTSTFPLPMAARPLSRPCPHPNQPPRPTCPPTAKVVPLSTITVGPFSAIVHSPGVNSRSRHEARAVWSESEDVGKCPRRNRGSGTPRPIKCDPAHLGDLKLDVEFWVEVDNELASSATLYRERGQPNGGLPLMRQVQVPVSDEDRGDDDLAPSGWCRLAHPPSGLDLHRYLYSPSGGTVQCVPFMSPVAPRTRVSISTRLEEGG